MAEQLANLITEHLFGRRVDRANDPGLVDRDHAIENIFDDRANACFHSFEGGQLPPHEHETVTIRNHQEGHGQEGQGGQSGCLDDAITFGRGVANFVDVKLALLERVEHLPDVDHQLIVGGGSGCRDPILGTTVLGCNPGYGGIVDPCFHAGADLREQLRLAGIIRHQDRKIAVVSVEIRDGALVGFGETQFVSQ